MGDERHTLEAIGNNFVWTKPDGTVVTFGRGTNSPKPASQGGTLTSIVYPNGFTVAVTLAGVSVNTNTGFQLKRVFESDTRPIDKGGQPAYPSSAESGWSAQNPKYVYGVNAAVEWCSWSATSLFIHEYLAAGDVRVAASDAADHENRHHERERDNRPGNHHDVRFHRL